MSKFFLFQLQNFLILAPHIDSNTLDFMQI